MIVFADSASESARGIKLLDVTSGEITEVARGSYPQLGPNGEIAFCDEHGILALANVMTPSNPTITGVRPSGCGPIGWSADGKLAILAGGPAGFSLYVRPASAQEFSRVMLAAALPGVSAPSWSSDSARIAIRMVRGVAVIDPDTGDLNRLDFDGAPQFAPTLPGLLAVLDAANETPTLAVFREGEKVAQRDFGDAPPDSFTWSPDSEWIATTSDKNISIWNWKSNESRVIATGETGGFTLGVAWLP